MTTEYLCTIADSVIKAFMLNVLLGQSDSFLVTVVGYPQNVVIGQGDSFLVLQNIVVSQGDTVFL